MSSLLRAYHLRCAGLSYQEVADATGYSKSGVHQSLQRLSTLVPSIPHVDAYDQVRIPLLTAVEEQLVASLTDAAKIEKASLNNVAYSLTQVSQLRRLEQGKSTENIGLMARLMTDVHMKLFSTTTIRSGAESGHNAELSDPDPTTLPAGAKRTRGRPKGKPVPAVRSSAVPE